MLAKEPVVGMVLNCLLTPPGCVISSFVTQGGQIPAMYQMLRARVVLRSRKHVPDETREVIRRRGPNMHLPVTHTHWYGKTCVNHDKTLSLL